MNPVAAEFLRRAENFYDDGAALSVHDRTERITDWFELEEQHGIRLLLDAKEFAVISKPSGMVCNHGSAVRNQGRAQHTNNREFRRKRNQRVTKYDSGAPFPDPGRDGAGTAAPGPHPLLGGTARADPAGAIVRGSIDSLNPAEG